MSTYADKIQRSLVESSSDFVFVVGAARSGTTLLHHYLNESSDAFIVCEDNPFASLTRQDYRSWFNGMWRNLSVQATKGYSIPEMEGAGGFWFDCYLSLKKRYKIVGSKISVGPFGSSDGHWTDLDEIDRSLQPFFQRYFSASTYLLTQRRPAENILSLHRMYPNVHVGSLLNAWIKCLQHQLILLTSMPRARFVFSDQVDLTTLMTICEAVGIRPPARNEDYILPVRQRASWVQGEHPELLALFAENEEYHNLLIQLEAAYAFLQSDIDLETGRGKPAVHTSELANSLWFELERLRGSPSATFRVS